MEKSAEKIAGIMGYVSNKTVWPIIFEIAKEANLEVKYPLLVKIGSGGRTYHTLKRTNGKYTHIVTYGKKMVLDKYDKERAKNWTTGKEIVSRKYFNGDMTFLNLIAHTILHEMSHALQVIAGDRHYGSVHNPEFYKWLTLLHKRCGNLVKQAVEEEAKKRHIELSFKASTENKTIKIDTHKKLSDVILHKIYAATIKNKHVLVKPIKKNRKTVDIVVTEGDRVMLGSMWRISKSMLRKT